MAPLSGFHRMVDSMVDIAMLGSSSQMSSFWQRDPLGYLQRVVGPPRATKSGALCFMGLVAL